jgi:hypothetical protein
MFAFVQPSFQRIKVSSNFKRSLKLWLLLACLLVTSKATSAATIIVPAGGDLQAAINSASFGDTIVLQSGASYTAPGQQVSFNLPLKSGGTGTSADYITITSSNLASLPAGRVSSADKVNMARIVALGGRGAFQVMPNAKYWRLQGLEITNSSSGTGAEHVVDLIGSVDAAYSRTTKPAHFIVDRCYIHPQEDGLLPTDPNYNFRTVSHGVTLNVADLTISNCRISGIFGVYRHDHTIKIDSEAVPYSSGPGAVLIDNNYLEAWYAPILTGGRDMDSDNFGVVASSPAPTTLSFAITLQGGSLPVAGDFIAVANSGKEYSACRIA